MKLCIPLLISAFVAIPSMAMEKLDFHIGWGVIPVAKAELSTDSRNTELKIRSVGIANWLYPIDTRMTSLLDEDGQRALHFTRKQREGRGGRHHRDIEVRFDWEEGFVHYTNYGVAEPPLELTGPTLDPLSTITFLRNADIVANTEHTYVVSDGRETITHKVRIGDLEEVRTHAGNFIAYRVIPSTEQFGGAFKESSDSNMILWVTRDKPHLPVKIESDVRVGSFSAILESELDHPSRIVPAAESVSPPTRRGRR